MIMIRQADRPYTAEDLAEMPTDGRRYEVLGGELVVSPSPSVRHQRVSLRLSAILETHLERTQVGTVLAAPFDVHLSEHDVIQPDLVVILRENGDRIRRNAIHGAPDLLIEIVSPSSAGYDRVRKSAIYSANGVPEYWIVDPDSQTILAQYLDGGRYHPIPHQNGLIPSRLIEGLVVDPDRVFSMPEWLLESASRT